MDIIFAIESVRVVLFVFGTLDLDRRLLYPVLELEQVRHLFRSLERLR